MQAFLEMLMRAARPEELLEPETLKRAVKDLQDEYLGLALRGESPSVTKSNDVVQRRRFLRDVALYFDMALLGDANLFRSDVRDALEVAATVLEYLFRTTAEGDIDDWLRSQDILECLFAGPLNDLLRSGLLYALAGKPASGWIVFRQLDDQLSRLIATDNLDQDSRKDIEFIAACLRVVGSLIGGRPQDLDAALRAGLKIEELLRDLETTARGGALLRATNACVKIIKDALSGGQLGESWAPEILEAHSLARKLRDPGVLWYLDTVDHLLRQFVETSVHNALNGYTFPEGYLDLLAASGTPRLWFSQVEAVRKGLLESDQDFVVRLPTGAGKSLLAELVVLNELSQNGGWCVYLAPTRALVRQAEKDLRGRLPKVGVSVRNVIAGAERAATVRQEVNTLSESKTVTVLTPEKLDVYLRFSPDEFADCCLCVVDEAHLLGEDERGMRLEVLLSILRVRNPNMRFVLFSAVLSNPEDLATWLGAADSYVDAHWRPTRQIKGLLVRETGTVHTRRELQAKQNNRWIPVARPQKGVPNRELEVETFDLGLILAREPSDLDHIEAGYHSFPGLVTAVRHQARDWTPRGYERWVKKQPTTTAPELATQLARKLYGYSQKQILFFSTPESAEKAARDIASFVPAVTSPPRKERLTKFVDTLASVVEADDPLLACVKRGVAYHHAQMPTVVKRLIEVAARQGTLDILCATNTLGEGLNTPAQVVIIAGGKHYSEENESRVDMPVRSFENIAGRAGRAFVATEGLVAFVPEDYHKVGLTYNQAHQYMLVDPEGLRVKSALVEVLNEFAEYSTISAASVLELSPQSQIVLLALNAAGIATENEVQAFVSGCYGGKSLAPGARRMVSGAMTRAISASRDRFGQELLSIFSQTGLSISDCVAMLSEIETSILGGETVSLRKNGSIDIEVIESILQVISKADGLWGKMRWNQLPISVHAFLVHGWITQTDHGALVARLNAGEYFAQRQNNGDLYKYFSATENVLAWGFGVAYLLMQHVGPDTLDRELGSLPLFVRYGVDSLAAALACLFGVSDRRAASALGRLYESERRQPPTFNRIERWLSRLDDKDVRRALPEQSVRQEVVLDDLRWMVGPSISVVRTTLLCTTLPTSTFFRLRRRKDKVVGFDLSDQPIGEIQPTTDLLELLTLGRAYGIILGSMDRGRVPVEVRLETDGSH